jgi:hypothetical protein
MHSARLVQFVLGNHDSHWRDLEDLDESAIDREPRRFVGGRNSWIAQSYLRLKPALEARGWEVRAGRSFVPGAISIVHRDDANDFASQGHETFLVVVRADRAPVAACDLAIVQNRIEPGPSERFMPLWPQPGLIARDPARGASIRRIAYHGRTSSAPRWFTEPAFHEALASRGVEFSIEATHWEDYREVDVSIAARDESSAVLATKPATKVYNAWLARVPALAAPEPAYREVRRSSMDFIEIKGAADVLRAVDMLRANPRLFQAMVQNGIERGREFSVEAIRTRWLDFLEEEVVPAYEGKRARLASRHLWHLRAMATQKALSKAHKMRVAYERWTNPAPLAAPRPAAAAASGQRAADHLADVTG